MTNLRALVFVAVATVAFLAACGSSDSGDDESGGGGNQTEAGAGTSQDGGASGDAADDGGSSGESSEAGEGGASAGQAGASEAGTSQAGASEGDGGISGAGEAGSANAGQVGDAYGGSSGESSGASEGGASAGQAGKGEAGTSQAGASEGDGGTSGAGEAGSANAGQASQLGGNGGEIVAAGGQAGSGQPEGGEAGQASAMGGSGGESQAGAGNAGDLNGGMGGAGGGEPVIVDPAPDFNEPGEFTSCAQGPDTDLEIFEFLDVSSSTMRFEGTATGAVGAGTYYVASEGQSIAGPIPTDQASGAFGVELPLFCGEQTVKLVWVDAADCQVAAVSRVVRVDCASDDIRLTLSWDELGDDYELHLIREGGTINDGTNDCTWTTCIGSDLDWGASGDSTDNPQKDVDNTGTYGPENIYYSNPEAGIYTVMVEHWGPGSAESDGSVILNVKGQTYQAFVENFPSHFVWNVGTIAWPSGTVVLAGEQIDCTANWSGGCTMAIP